MILHYAVRIAIILLLVTVVMLIRKTLEVHNSFDKKDPRAIVVAYNWLILVGLAVYIGYSITTW